MRQHQVGTPVGVVEAAAHLATEPVAEEPEGALMRRVIEGGEVVVVVAQPEAVQVAAGAYLRVAFVLETAVERLDVIEREEVVAVQRRGVLLAPVEARTDVDPDAAVRVEAGDPDVLPVVVALAADEQPRDAELGGAHLDLGGVEDHLWR